MTKLKQAFLEYNARYFSGRLPKDTVVMWDPEDLPCTGRFRAEANFRNPEGKIVRMHSPDPTYVDRYRIWISRKVQWDLKECLSCVARMTLLHEMCHLKLYKKYPKDTHGPRFQKEMKRLANLGAFNTLW